MVVVESANWRTDMVNSKLKSMLTNFINEKNEQAELDLHNYLATKIKSAAGLIPESEKEKLVVGDLVEINSPESANNKVWGVIKKVYDDGKYLVSFGTDDEADYSADEVSLANTHPED